ncbi:MAG: galactose ABC transporter substrate-binding protein [Verrucomicrobiae bacterium]|nr:galactose ABC transporter substrate-binding protein [Verrucomicrobiae bacterium]
MKKILAFLLGFALLLPLAACGGTTATTTPAGTTAAPAAGGKVHVFYYDYGDTYIASVRDAMDKALNDAGLEFQNYDAQNNQTTQSEQVATAVQSASLLVVNYVQTSATDPAQDIVDKAKAAGIPVIFFNREVPNELINSYEKATFVGTDAAEAGHLQGKMVGDYVLANFDKVDLNGDGKISYVMFKGENGNNESEMRTQYGVEDADAVLTAAGKPALVYFDAAASSKFQVDMGGKWSAQAAQEYMSTNLATFSVANNNMIELVICNNDGMAEGAISALNDAGYNTGDAAKMIPVFGVDATDSAKSLIADGKMTGTVKQDAEGMAVTIVEMAENATAGKDFFDGITGLNIDDEASKVRIPYQPYTGE